MTVRLVYELRESIKARPPWHGGSYELLVWNQIIHLAARHPFHVLDPGTLVARCRLTIIGLYPFFCCRTPHNLIRDQNTMFLTIVAIGGHRLSVYYI